MNLDRVTDSHVKLNTLGDTQECSNNSHHKLAFHSVFSKVTQKMVLCKVKDFFDSGSNVSMILRSALPKGIITKFPGDTKLVKTLAGHLKMHKAVTTRD
jgi:hypothetical protein